MMSLGDVMKNLSLLALLILPCAVEAQTSPKLIALSSTSTVAVADIRKGFHKKCPNVSITFKPLKADYALEAVADTINPISRSPAMRYRFTLLSRTGDVLYSTSPHKFSNAINKCVHGNQQTKAEECNP
jgi:hypothetical protein